MDDSSCRDPEQAQEATRWLLVVLVVTAVLAGAVIVAADIADLIGRRWQQVGVLSAAVTVVALVIGLLVVLRALDPWSEAAPSAPDGNSAPDVNSESDGDGANGADDPPGAEDVEIAGENGGVAARKARRRLLQRYRNARLVVAVVVVVALAGMVGMTIASVEDGDKVEARDRRAAALAAAPETAPIAEPQPVAVQLTSAGLARVARAMGCTGAELGGASLQGWAVAGDFREPTVVIFAPDPACRNARVQLASGDGFVYPTILAPIATTTTAPPAATPTTVAGLPPAAPAG